MAWIPAQQPRHPDRPTDPVAHTPLAPDSGDAPSVVELRIHGVGGPTAQEILQWPIVTRVAGDNNAGFYRPRPARDGSTAGPAGVQEEAYSWGTLTSGAAARALWLLLLPFLLVNIAPWARPSVAGTPRRRDHLLLGACRTIALTLTATLVLAAVGIAVDVAAWQCASTPAPCAAASYLSVLSHGALATPGRRIGVAAVIPCAVIVLLWVLARRTWARYEAYRAPQHSTGSQLADPTFWSGVRVVQRLRAVHITVALATVAASVLIPALRFDLSHRVPNGYLALGIPLASLLATVGLVCVALVWWPALCDRENPARSLSVVVNASRVLSIGAVVAVVGYAGLPRPRWAATGALPGHATMVSAIFWSQLALLLLLAAVVWSDRRTPRSGPAAACAGFATPVIAGLGIFVATGFSAGLTYRVADILRGDLGTDTLTATGTPQWAAPPPAPYAWAAFGAVIAALSLLIAAFTVQGFLLPRLVRRAVHTTDSEFPDGRRRWAWRAKLIDRAIGQAQLTDSLPALVTAVVVAGLAALAAAALVSPVHTLLRALAGPHAAAWWHGTTGPLATAMGAITELGTWLIGVGTIGLIILGIQAYRQPQTRRLVGIIWDIGTFWPRDTHPLAPPCYAERAVPELVIRATWLAGHQIDDAGGADPYANHPDAVRRASSPARPPVSNRPAPHDLASTAGQPGARPTGDGSIAVVLSGHSQGAILAAAALWQLAPATRARTALLTYGSPLARLYSRFFPAYFGSDALDELATTVSDRGRSRWLDLWRATDPIGGSLARLGLTGLARRLSDPIQFGVPAGDTVPMPIHGHSLYPVDPAFGDAVAELAELPVHKGASTSPPSHVADRRG